MQQYCNSITLAFVLPLIFPSMANSWRMVICSNIGTPTRLKIFDFQKGVFPARGGGYIPLHPGQTIANPMLHTIATPVNNTYVYPRVTI